MLELHVGGQGGHVPLQGSVSCSLGREHPGLHPAFACRPAVLWRQLSAFAAGPWMQEVHTVSKHHVPSPIY